MPKSIGIKITKRPDSKKLWYYLRYKGKIYRGSLDTEDRAEAEEKTYRIQHEITRGTDIVGDSNIRIDEFLKTYLEWAKQEHRPQTVKSYIMVSRSFDKFPRNKYPKDCTSKRGNT